MNRKLLDYFLIFGNPDGGSDENKEYWERDYVNPYQILAGLIFLPIALIGLLLVGIGEIKIK